ncbi:MAG: glycosyltransferase family 2 protein [Clostridia bacterium]
MEIVKEILKIVYYAIDIFIILYFGYYVVTGMFALVKNKHKIRKYKAKNKIAVLIAARNEEKVIVHLLDSLNKQNYPKELYDTFVIPNNCTDGTRKVSIEKGAKVIDCTVPVSSKGEVLKYTFNYMKKNHDEYDAFIIFDADNIVHKNFLRRMNDALCAGFKVAQGYRDSKNPSDTWISCCYSLFYWVQNFFFNQARMNMGWSSSINGTGFMIEKSVIEKNGFETVTLTEDIEFAAQCAINNQKIAFVKDAITYDEQPLTFSQSWKQRKRWSIGTIQCLFKYFNPLIKNGIKNKTPQCMDMALFFMAPLVQVLAFFVIVMLSVYNMLGIQVSDIMKMLYDNKIASLVLRIFSIYWNIFICSYYGKEKNKKNIQRNTYIINIYAYMDTYKYSLLYKKRLCMGTH